MSTRHGSDNEPAASFFDRPVIAASRSQGHVAYCLSDTLVRQTVTTSVSGPGVNSSLSFVVSEIFKFVSVSVESIRQHHASHDRVRSGLPHALAANVCGIHDDIFNRIRVHFAGILAQHSEIRELARRDRSFDLLLE